MWKTLFQLYISFLKIGAFTFGGGYAMIPIIAREAVDKKKWLSEDEMNDYITLSQSLPGVVGINSATSVGNKVAGFPGALAATLGMITPSLLIIMTIASFFERFQEWEIVQHAFMGIRAVVAALILNAFVRISKTSVKSIFQAVIAVLASVCILFLKISPQYIILGGAISAVICKTAFRRKKDADID